MFLKQISSKGNFDSNDFSYPITFTRLCGPSDWGLGEGLTTPHRKKKQLVTKYYTGSRNYADSLERPSDRKCVRDLEHGMLEVSLYGAGSPKRGARMDLTETGWTVWTECIWIRIGTSGWPL
jgi:murein tripeptide amidase MpaA